MKTLGIPFQWNPGQHMAVIGITGSGKSTLASRLLDLRRFVVILRTKSDDVKYTGTVRRTTASALDDPRHDRIELQPDYRVQAGEIAQALDRVWQQRGWTCYVDELFYVDKRLGCGGLVDMLLTQGRSHGITVVTAMQRPVAVTRFAIGEATHVISFGLEGRDAKILGEVSSPRLAKCVLELKQYEFVWYHVPSREMWRGRLNMKTGRLEGGMYTGGQ